MSELDPPLFSDQPAVPFVGQKSQDEEAIVLPNMEFFPAIELLDFQLRYRVDASQFKQRQIQALQQAMSTTNKELLDGYSVDSNINWVCQKVRKGFFELSEVPCNRYGDESEKVRLYFSCIYALAKSLLIKRYPKLYLGKKDRGDQQDPDNNTADDYLQEYRETLRQLMDKSRCTIDLI